MQRAISASEVLDLQYPHTILCIIMYKGASHLLSMPLQLSKELCHTGCILLLHKHAPAPQTSFFAMCKVFLTPTDVAALGM